MWTGRLPAVIYPVSIDPDGFRGTTPNHLTLSKTSDVFVGFGLLVTLGSGAYAIYHRWYFAELNLHLRLRE